jgi:hypothetical protein
MFFNDTDGMLNEILDEDGMDTFEQLEQIILTESAKEGLLDEADTYNPLSEASYFTGQGSRGGKGSVIQFGKDAKMKQLQSKYAMALALAAKNPKAKKAKGLRRKYLKFLADINKQYKSQAQKLAKDAIKNAQKYSNIQSTYANRAKGKSTSSKSASIKQQGQTKKTAQSRTSKPTNR